MIGRTVNGMISPMVNGNTYEKPTKTHFGTTLSLSVSEILYAVRFAAGREIRHRGDLARLATIYRILPSLIRHRTPGALVLVGFQSKVVLVDRDRRHAGELVLPGPLSGGPMEHVE